MGRVLVRQTPTAMPTSDNLNKIFKNLPFVIGIAGCRGTVSQNVDPNDVHAELRGYLPTREDVKGKKVVIFVHGYNVTTELPPI